MIIAGGRAANELGMTLFGFDNINAWAMVISLLIGVWIALEKMVLGS